MGWRPSPTSGNRFPTPTSANNLRSDRSFPKPYLGYCQICRIQGHTAKRCPFFRLIPIETSTNTSTTTPNSSWQPKAHFAVNTSNTPTWLLDSGASHHVTSDLRNLSIHAPYNGSDDIMIGDGTRLPITHTGSSLSTLPMLNFP